LNSTAIQQETIVPISHHLVAIGQLGPKLLASLDDHKPEKLEAIKQALLFGRYTK
jgi:hypothetical protein